MKWEYISQSNLGILSLDEWGDAGWELVAVVVKPDRHGETSTHFYFKRPKKSNEQSSVESKD